MGGKIHTPSQSRRTYQSFNKSVRKQLFNKISIGSHQPGVVNAKPSLDQIDQMFALGTVNLLLRFAPNGSGRAEFLKNSALRGELTQFICCSHRRISRMNEDHDLHQK